MRCGAKFRRACLELVARVNPRPVIVLGNQKSGTTAISALLAQSTGLSVTLDLKREIERPRLPDVRGGRLSFEQFIRINKLAFSREIVKEPSLTFFYEELMEFFPEARFVFIVRDPRDNIRSILNRYRVPGDLPELTGEYWDRLTAARKLTFDSQWLGLKQDHYIGMLAARWNLAVELFRRYQDKTRLVKYEDFLNNKVQEVEALARSIGLKPINDITSLVDIQYQPKGNPHVDLRNFFGGPNLSRIEEICKEGMAWLGYEAG